MIFLIGVGKAPKEEKEYGGGGGRRSRSLSEGRRPTRSVHHDVKGGEFFNPNPKSSFIPKAPEMFSFGGKGPAEVFDFGGKGSSDSRVGRPPSYDQYSRSVGMDNRNQGYSGFLTNLSAGSMNFLGTGGSLSSGNNFGVGGKGSFGVSSGSPGGRNVGIDGRNQGYSSGYDYDQYRGGRGVGLGMDGGFIDYSSKGKAGMDGGSSLYAGSDAYYSTNVGGSSLYAGSDAYYSTNIGRSYATNVGGSSLYAGGSNGSYATNVGGSYATNVGESSLYAGSEAYDPVINGAVTETSSLNARVIQATFQRLRIDHETELADDTLPAKQFCSNLLYNTAPRPHQGNACNCDTYQDLIMGKSFPPSSIIVPNAQTEFDNKTIVLAAIAAGFPVIFG